MAGRPPKEKSFANMLNIAIKEILPDGRSKLRALADTVIDEAIAGNMQAAREVADRLDGKAVQAIEAEIEGNVGVTFQTVYEASNAVERQSSTEGSEGTAFSPSPS